MKPLLKTIENAFETAHEDDIDAFLGDIEDVIEDAIENAF